MPEPWRNRPHAREDGQTAAECAIVLTVLTAGAVGVFALLGGEIAALLDALLDVLPV
jgi:Flp pilus assembly pilin Flp